MKAVYAATLIALALPASADAAQVGKTVSIAACGASNGYGYFPKFGLIANDDNAGKWAEDGISRGRITLTLDTAGNFDVTYSDATGRQPSASDQGAHVVLVGKLPGILSVLVAYPNALTETYTFVRSTNGAEVIWTSNKFGTPIPKVAAYRAACSFLNLK